MLVIGGVDHFQLLEGIDAGVQGKEVREHAAEQVQVAFAEECPLIQLQPCAQATNGLALDQPIHARFHGRTTRRGGRFAGAWAQVVRPQQLQHGVRQLGQVILLLEPQLGREERKGLHQAFDIWVAGALAQQPGQLWVVLGEVVPQLMQVLAGSANTG